MRRRIKRKEEKEEEWEEGRKKKIRNVHSVPVQKQLAGWYNACRLRRKVSDGI